MGRGSTLPLQGMRLASILARSARIWLVFLSDANFTFDTSLDNSIDRLRFRKVVGTMIPHIVDQS
jgi:hypothetical protein